ncbi:hypothetical protein AVEN_103638-1 [Araneus ventricosus]|uniref:Uncharacterized protein n=1 Tax=Araneus ventricosus TaxID=182803 RepID=A0A4Y2HBJ0_ARAVE|nr:hypothetical protein AVEN_103638-1 [Araneus ventricosus]
MGALSRLDAGLQDTPNVKLPVQNITSRYFPSQIIPLISPNVTLPRMKNLLQGQQFTSSEEVQDEGTGGGGSVAALASSHSFIIEM